jgi:hypothetical protein
MTAGQAARNIGLPDGWSVHHYERTGRAGKNHHACFSGPGYIRDPLWIHAASEDELVTKLQPYMVPNQTKLL